MQTGGAQPKCCAATKQAPDATDYSRAKLGSFS
jgi:hypothetical protein